MIVRLNYLLASFGVLLFYGFITTLFPLDGVSVVKITALLLVWFSFAITINFTIKNWGLLKKEVPRTGRVIFILLLLWNLSNVIRGFLDSSISITTLLGNVYNALSLLVPFVFFLGLKPLNLVNINRFLMKIFTLGVLFLVISSTMISSDFSDKTIRVSNLFLGLLVFMIPLLPILSKKEKMLVLFFASLLLILGILLSSRTSVLRESILLVIGLLMTYSFVKKSKVFYKIIYCIQFIPIILLFLSIQSGNSVLQSQLSSLEDEELKVDTRTFLYTEMFTDIERNNSLLWGKGASGTYYSDYFSIVDGDSDTRLTSEVGLLAILLKTGLLGVFFYLSLFAYVSYMAIFKSNNMLSKGVGVFIVVHVFLFYIENIVSYSSYNFLLWFFCGLGISKTIRNLNDIQIKKLLYGKKSKGTSTS